MNTVALALVVLAANVLGAAMAVPQARKLRRTTSIEGISASWIGISVALNAGWGVYAVGVADWSILPVSIVSVLAYIDIARTLLRCAGADGRRLRALMAGTGAAVVAVPLATAAVGGWPAAGIALGAAYAVQLTPAVRAVYRSHDVSGVSAATWAMAFAEAALWGVYGATVLDIGLLALATTGVTMSSLVLVRLAVRRPRRDRRIGTSAWTPSPAVA